MLWGSSTPGLTAESLLCSDLAYTVCVFVGEEKQLGARGTGFLGQVARSASSPVFT